MRFLIQSFKDKRPSQGGENISDDLSIAKAVQNPYTRNTKIKPIEMPKRVESVIEKAIDYPESIPTEAYVGRKGFMAAL